MLRTDDVKIADTNKNKTNINSSYKVSLQDHRIGLILIFIVPKKSLSHLNLISIGKYTKSMKKNRIKMHLNVLKFQSEIKNMWRK